MEPRQRLGAVARLARWCSDHRTRALVLCVAVLVVVGGVSSAVGTRTSTDFSLPNTESQEAQDVLQREFPS
jgi:RND superfamily putative drug exporter